MTELPIDLDAAARLIEPLTEIVARAGAAILAVKRGGVTAHGKSDGSPVTEADLAADRVIAEGLARLLPHVAVVSEERCDGAARPAPRKFFLVDPLDGTKEFVAGRDEFTVNVALVQDGVPLLGIVGAPALGLVWRGVVGRGAERLRIRESGFGPAESIRTRAAGGPLVAMVSRSHGEARSEAFIDRRPGAVREVAGSAIKFCRVAEGRADIYPRLAPTCEWDVAAGHALVVAAGGKVSDSQGAALQFGTAKNFIVPEFIAWGDPKAENP